MNGLRALSILLALAGAWPDAEAQQPPQTAATSPGKTMSSIKADRLPPPDVPPVVIGTTRYEVIHYGKRQGLSQNGGYIAARDVASGRELWTLKVYDVPFDPKMEADVQDIFIESMGKAFFSNKLKIVDEQGRHYVVDVKTREVTASK